MRTSACVTVQLGQHDTVEIEAFVKFACSIHGVLSSHRIDNKQHFLRVDGILDVLNLIHHLAVDSKASGGIDYHQVKIVGLCILDGIPGNLNWIFDPSSVYTGTSICDASTLSCSMAAGRYTSHATSNG